MRMRLGYLLVFLMVVLNDGFAQWCCIDSSLIIKDKSTATLKLLITSALNNDLASQSQGVCGVRIKFDHKFIGDLTIDLISPAGQKVRLIGPLGNSGISSFSKWSVTFVPCGLQAIPDPGFKKRWDNQQSWGILGKFYSGTYYPQMGCLEDFNTGPVNGIWTLQIADAEKFYEGTLESFCLLFCDQNGVNCSDCSPNGGVFPQDTLNYCFGDPDLLILDTVSFPVYKPDPTIYAYKYIVSSNDQIIGIGDNIDLRMAPPGDYLVCGLSYLVSDSTKLPNLGESIGMFRNQLVVNANGFCAEISKNCILVSIHPVFANQIYKVNLCQGDSLTIDNIDYKQAGIYNITLPSAFGCDSIITLFLDIVDLAINRSNLDTIDCLNPVLTLDVSGSILTTKTNISWSTMDGHFSDLSDSLKVKVDKEGTYKIIMSDGFCIDSTEIIIYKKDNIPSLQVILDSINCIKDTASLIARSNTLNLNYNWSDGLNSISADSILKTNQAGNYFVTITDQNGCSNYTSIELIADTLKPKLDFNLNELSCKQDSINLDVTSDQTLISFLWEGPSLFKSFEASPKINVEGFYTLTAVSNNGCSSQEVVEVVSVRSIPDYNVEIDTLNCTNNFEIMLRAASRAYMDSIVYSNATGYRSTILSPVIREPGLYNVQLVDTAGCVFDTSFVVTIDSLKPMFALQADMLDCLIDSIQIQLNFLLPSISDSISWSGPIGFQSNLQNPFVKEIGLYKVRVTSDNGCFKEDSIQVFQDTLKPVIVLTSSTLDCKTQQVVLEATVNNINIFNWTGPNFFSSNLEDPTVQDSGLYKLIVTSFNGCTAEKSIEIKMDRQSPILTLIGDTITCAQDSILLILLPNGFIDTVSWIGPFNFKSFKDSVWVNTPGRYEVYVRGTNGCLDSSEITILLDTMPPTLFLSTDTISCSKSSVLIQVATQDSIIKYKWKDFQGNLDSVKNLEVQQTGWYSLEVTGLNGCNKKDSIFVFENFDKPKFQFIPDTISCKDSIAKLLIQSTDTNLRYSWAGPSIIQNSDSFILANKIGWYYYSITNHFDCFVADSFYLEEFIVKPTIIISDPKINCTTKQAPFLHANTMDSLFQFTWTYPSGAMDQNKSIPIQVGGYYKFFGENIFGCFVFDSVLVSFDTMVPIINAVYLDSLTCSKLQAIPLIETNPVNVTYQWRGPMNFQSTLPNPILTKAGLYSLTLTGPNFCFLDTTLELFKDSLLPTIQTMGAEITCKSDSVQIEMISSDSLLSVFWQSPTGTIYDVRNPFVKDSGWYTLIIIAKNNCLLTDSAFVNFNKSKPKINVQDTSIQCQPDSTQLILNTVDSISNYFWQGPNGFRSFIKNPYVKDSGEYRVRLVGVNDCETLDTIHIASNKILPDILTRGGILNCKDSIFNLTASFDSKIQKFLWSGPNLLDSSNRSILIKIPGIYRIDIENEFGCKQDTSILVSMDTIRPQSDISALDTLICETKEVRLNANGTCINCLYEWSTVNGFIVSGMQSDLVKVSKEGNYKLSITDTKNGCKFESSFELLRDSSKIRTVSLNIKDPSCFQFSDGHILFDSIFGGTKPYQFSLDDTKYSDLNDLLNQPSGNYRIFLRDRNGCKFDTIVNLIDPAPLNLMLGLDTVINLGATYRIPVTTNADTSQLLSLMWDPLKNINCATCLDVTASPGITTRYALKITDEFGCQAEDDILITVIIKPTIYIPNVFSPNKDQVNDYFTLFSGENTVLINSLEIFDRWGNEVFEKSNFEVNGQLPVWDGSFKGKDLNPGVYLFVLTIQLADHSQSILKGDITILR
ncbi:MAG: gliding motility-associated C-terminal domain-containing protein [Saprospiraceae bacterium]|nr:gliding motility-associated C-terminal domain-containing protein [Saprospiraceae bacterium]